MAADLWTRDEAVLDYLIDRLEVQGQERVDLRSGPPVGFPGGGERSLVRLLRDHLIQGVLIAETDSVYVVTAVTPEGLRRSGAWPSPQKWPDEVAATLEAIANQTTDPEKATLLRRASSAVGGTFRDLAVGYAIARLGG